MSARPLETAGRPAGVNFLSRLVVVAAGLPLVLGGAYVGGWFLFAIVLAASLVALHEVYRLARPLRPLVLAGYVGAIAALLGAELGGPADMLGGFLVTFVLAFLFAAVAETRQSTTVTIAATILGAAWIGLGLGFALLVRELGPLVQDGRDAIFALLLTVFVTDSVAYLGGRALGRHKMTPLVSPGKTWEGFTLGAIAGVVTAFFALYGTAIAGGWRGVVFGAVVVAAATAGDLFESLVKRDLGVKDTGRVLLGHGGVLDRIDSLLFAAPAAYFTLLALGKV
jgi:phosphatidate cytidylyltransferase